MARFAIASILVIYAGASLRGDTFEEIASLPLAEQPAAVVETFLNDALDIGSQCIALEFRVQHNYLEHKHSGKYELISSTDQIYQFCPLDQSEWSTSVMTYSEERQKSYVAGKQSNNIVLVQIDCAPPNTDGYLEEACRAIRGLPFAENHSPAFFGEFLRSLKSEGVKDIPKLGPVFVLVENTESRRREFYFGERFGRLVSVGSDQTHSEPTYTDTTYKTKSDIKRVGRAETRLDYKQLNEHCIPSGWKTTLVSEYLDEDGKPTQPPMLELERTVRVTKASLLDSFPTEKLNIKIPPEAEIFDNCGQKEQIEAVLPESVAVQGGSSWRWLFGIAGLACVALGGYKFLRGRKG